MTGPRYLVWVNDRQFYECASLAQALECKQAFGGTVYEPLGMTTAEKAAAEKVAADPVACAERLPPEDPEFPGTTVRVLCWDGDEWLAGRCNYRTGDWSTRKGWLDCTHWMPLPPAPAGAGGEGHHG